MMEKKETKKQTKPNKTKTKNKKRHIQQIILELMPIAIFCLVIETKGQIFRGIPGFYSTNGYTAGIFSAHLVSVKCEVFTTTSAREIQLCARPATQQKRYPYFRQIAYASPLRMREDLSERGSIVPLSAQCINPVGCFKITLSAWWQRKNNRTGQGLSVYVQLKPDITHKDLF